MTGVLSRAEILELIGSRPPLVENCADPGEQVQANGIDLTLRDVSVLQSMGRIAESNRERVISDATPLFFDAFGHVGFVLVQAFGHAFIGGRQDLCGQNGGVFGAGLSDGHRGHRHAGRHLNCGQQGIQPLQVGRINGNTDDRQGGMGGQDAGQMGGMPCTGDNHFYTAGPCGS